MLNSHAEHTSPESWELWLKEKRRALPEPWPAEGQRRRGSDGSDWVGRFRMVDLDPLEQTFTRQVRLEKRVSGELVASEESTLRGSMVFKSELILMLHVAGFREITVRGDYTDQPATAGSEELVFTAVK